MDKEMFEAAQAAEDAHKEHARDCKNGCQGVGTATRDLLSRRARCTAGSELFDVWNGFRPAKLRGDRKAPDGCEFTWGVITATHHIGDAYQIVEYQQDKSGHSRAKEWAEHGTTRFHPYIDRKDTSTGYETLETAVIGAIAYTRGGPNSQAGFFACKILGLYDEQ